MNGTQREYGTSSSREGEEETIPESTKILFPYTVKLRKSVREQKSMYTYILYLEFKTPFNVKNGIAVYPWQYSHCIHWSVAKVAIEH